MAQFKNMYKVELNNGIAPVVSLKQIYYADVEANRIGAIVTMNGQPFPLSGTCTGSAILADGSTVPMTGVIDGNQAYIDLDSSCYSVEGQIKIFVKITTGGVTTTLLAAVGTVQLTETDTVIDPGTIIPSVSALITAIEDAVESIPADYTALLETIAPMYANLTFPVKAGQWCWYSGVLYEANQEISTSENWTAAHWKTTTVGGSVSELKSAIETIERWAWPENNNITLLNQIVAEGRGPIAAPVGTALYVDKDDAQIAMNVLDHDYHTPANSAIPHTCTIGMRDCFENRQFDAPEALIKVVDGLAAGSHFYLTLYKGASGGSTGQDGTYGGTLGAEQAIPAGGYLRHTTMGVYQSSYNASQITGGKWIAYDTSFNQIGAQIATDSGDTTGTNFGTATASTYQGNSEHVNFTERNAYGCNRIDQSAWLQYANAEGTGWWAQKNEWDFPPASVATIKGFLTGLDPVMKAAMVKTKIRVALPNCDGGGHADIETYVFPLSMTEVGFGANNSQYETSWGLNNTLKTTALAFYQGATNADRIKKLAGSARY
ncbi:MAG: hypothetical protein II008_22350, partial [Oscillospiraceae bacterium]|nr:hypothetical protein [Oscillospiraceae bacterium]